MDLAGAYATDQLLFLNNPTALRTDIPQPTARAEPLMVSSHLEEVRIILAAAT